MFKKSVILLALSLGFNAIADEMDETFAPTGMIVKLDEKTGERTLLQVNNLDLANVDTAEEAKAVVGKVDKKENVVKEYSVVSSANEMDEASSTRAWYWYSYYGWNNWNTWGNWNYNNYYYGSFGWYNYSYSYSYGWYTPGYRFYFYW